MAKKKTSAKKSDKAKSKPKKTAAKGSAKRKPGATVFDFAGQLYTLQQLQDNYFKELCLCVDLAGLSQADFDALKAFADAHGTAVTAKLVGTPGGGP